MGEESRELESQIERARNALGRDIDVVQDKVRQVQDSVKEVGNQVRRTVDWRYQFQERPGTLIGIAFGVGALLSLFAPRSRSRRASRVK